MKKIKLITIIIIFIFTNHFISTAQVTYGNTTPTGIYPSAIGYGTKASSYTLATGYYSEANGSYSTAFGYYTETNHGFANAFGQYTNADGMASFAAGEYSVANKRSTVAMGFSNDATADHAFAFGINTTASGKYSTTLNDYNTASAYRSIAVGFHTIASYEACLATGKYNVGLSGALFEVGNGTGSGRSNAFTVYNNGNVGIGTTDTHGYKLAVVGNLGIKGKIEAEEVKVFTPLWSDYVFSNDYKLMDLKELDEYINKNNHLPGIPTNLEIKVNGIRLGYMNSLLIKKIEELTLYIIEQDVKINKLIKENDELKQLISKFYN